MRPLPDVLEIEPLAKPPNCTITVPGSKSITNRALILAALADGKCTLRGALWADDTQVMVDSLGKLGFEVTVEPDPNEECNRTITVVGHGGEIPVKKAELYVGNAGTAARFLTALVASGHGEYRITGDGRMHERPMQDLFGALRALGAEVEAANERLPATIRARGLRKVPITVSAVRSSQFASALLLLGLDTLVSDKDEPGGYLSMTRRMVRQFRPDWTIEPDLSSGTYFVAGGFLTGGSVEVANWRKDSLQLDGHFPSLLPPPARVSRLTELGDSVLALAICALVGNQPLQIADAARLRVQETDRIKAMVTELRRVGAKAEEHEDGFTVWPARAGAIARRGHRNVQ